LRQHLKSAPIKGVISTGLAKSSGESRTEDHSHSRHKDTNHSTAFILLLAIQTQPLCGQKSVQFE